jgi:hypothetical protein
MIRIALMLLNGRALGGSIYTLISNHGMCEAVVGSKVLATVRRNVAQNVVACGRRSNGGCDPTASQGSESTAVVLSIPPCLFPVANETAMQWKRIQVEDCRTIRSSPLVVLEDGLEHKAISKQSPVFRVFRRRCRRPPGFLLGHGRRNRRLWGRRFWRFNLFLHRYRSKGLY